VSWDALVICQAPKAEIPGEAFYHGIGTILLTPYEERKCKNCKIARLESALRDCLVSGCAKGEAKPTSLKGVSL